VYTEPHSDFAPLDHLQAVRGGFVWATNGWPARLDLATRESRPLVQKPVAELAVVDGYRVFALRYADDGHTEIDEVAEGAALTPVVDRGFSSVDRLLAGPQAIYWRLRTSSGSHDEGMNVLSGTSVNGSLPVGTVRATHADHARLYTVVVGDADNQPQLVVPGEYPLAKLPQGGAFTIAGGDGGPVYVTVDGLLYQYSPVDEPFTPITGGAHISALASDGEVVFMMTCDGPDGAALARLYPAS
jgi:hypothetical protein